MVSDRNMIARCPEKGARGKLRAVVGGAPNSPGSCEGDTVGSPRRRDASLTACSSGERAGLWRSGSASHWQCGGRGFESRQVHSDQAGGLSIGVVPRNGVSPFVPPPGTRPGAGKAFWFCNPGGGG